MSEETLQPDDITQQPGEAAEQGHEPTETAVADGGGENQVQDPTPGMEGMPFPQLSLSPSAEDGENASLLMDLSLPVSVELGRTSMLIKDLMVLAPGAVIELDKLVGEPVDLIVNDKKLAEGEVVVIDENFAVRITSISSISDTVGKSRISR